MKSYLTIFCCFLLILTVLGMRRGDTESSPKRNPSSSQGKSSLQKTLSSCRKLAAAKLLRWPSKNRPPKPAKGKAVELHQVPVEQPVFVEHTPEMVRFDAKDESNLCAASVIHAEPFVIGLTSGFCWEELKRLKQSGQTVTARTHNGGHYDIVSGIHLVPDLGDNEKYASASCFTAFALVILSGAPIHAFGLPKEGTAENSQEHQLIAGHWVLNDGHWEGNGYLVGKVQDIPLLDWHLPTFVRSGNQPGIPLYINVGDDHRTLMAVLFSPQVYMNVNRFVKEIEDMMVKAIQGSVKMETLDSPLAEEVDNNGS